MIGWVRGLSPPPVEFFFLRSVSLFLSLVIWEKDLLIHLCPLIKVQLIYVACEHSIFCIQYCCSLCATMHKKTNKLQSLSLLYLSSILCYRLSYVQKENKSFE